MYIYVWYLVGEQIIVAETEFASIAASRRALFYYRRSRFQELVSK